MNFGRLLFLVLKLGGIVLIVLIVILVLVVGLVEELPQIDELVLLLVDVS